MTDYKQVYVEPEPFGEVPEQIIRHIYSVASMGLSTMEMLPHWIGEMPPYEEQEIPWVQVTCEARDGKIILFTEFQLGPLAEYLRDKFRLPKGLSKEPMFLTPPARVYFQELVAHELRELLGAGKLVKGSDRWVFNGGETK